MAETREASKKLRRTLYVPRKIIHGALGSIFCGAVWVSTGFNRPTSYRLPVGLWLLLCAKVCIVPSTNNFIFQLKNSASICCVNGMLKGWSQNVKILNICGIGVFNTIWYSSSYLIFNLKLTTLTKMKEVTLLLRCDVVDWFKKCDAF